MYIPLKQCKHTSLPHARPNLHTRNYRYIYKLIYTYNKHNKYIHIKTFCIYTLSKPGYEKMRGERLISRLVLIRQVTARCFFSSNTLMQNFYFSKLNNKKDNAYCYVD